MRRVAFAPLTLLVAPRRRRERPGRAGGRRAAVLDRLVGLRVPHAGPRQGPEVSLGAPAGNRFTAWAGFEFHPLLSTNEYVKGPALLIFNGALVSVTDGGIYEAQIRLPDKALWRFFDVAGWHDHATEELVVTVLERCLPFLEGGNPSETVLVTRTYVNRGGAFFDGPAMGNLRIDNAFCTYHARARFGTAGGGSAGVLVQLAKVRAEWRAFEIFADGFESGDTSAWSP